MVFALSFRNIKSLIGNLLHLISKQKVKRKKEPYSCLNHFPAGPEGLEINLQQLFRQLVTQRFFPINVGHSEGFDHRAKEDYVHSSGITDSLRDFSRIKENRFKSL
jgi:hypothetical protein